MAGIVRAMSRAAHRRRHGTTARWARHDAAASRRADQRGPKRKQGNTPGTAMFRESTANLTGTLKANLRQPVPRPRSRRGRRRR